MALVSDFPLVMALTLDARSLSGPPKKINSNSYYYFYEGSSMPRWRRPERAEKGMEFKLQLAAFYFRADQGGKLKLELHAFF